MSVTPVRDANAPAAAPAPAPVIPFRKKPARIPFTNKRIRMRWLKAHWVSLSAAVCIGLPIIATSVYLGFIASDRYAVDISLAVRGQDVAAVDALGMLGLGGQGGSLSSDSYIMIDFIRSRAMVEALSGSIDLRQDFGRDGIDPLSRLSKDSSIEEMTEYWQKMVTASYESSTGIIRVEVTAFDPKETLDLAKAVVTASESLVNRLASESRADAVRAAEAEVAQTEQQQRMLRSAMRKFREEEQLSDPVRRAAFHQEMIETMKGKLATIDTQLTAAKRFLDDKAPSVVVLRNERQAIEEQMQALEKEVGTSASDASPDGSGRSVASMLSTFEELTAEREFAEKSYMSALASLEHARQEADRKTRYLATYLIPSLPEEALYPERIKGIILTALGAALLWALGILVIFGIKDHI